MHKSCKETAVANIPKEELVCFNGDGLGYTDFLIKQLSAQLAERIMNVLSHESEIVASLSDLQVKEYMPTNSIEYRRQINWCPLVRCKDCKWFDMSDIGGTIQPIVYRCKRFARTYRQAEDFCSYGERKETEDE